METTPGMLEFWRRIKDPHTEQGLYLCVKETDFIALDVTTIQAMTQAFWSDASLLDITMRQSAEFKPCPVCSHFGEDFLCQSIRPMLPLVKIMDQFASHDETLAGYRDAAGLTYIMTTTMQRALQFVIQFGVLGFCDVGQRYKHWFTGAHPLMTTMEVAKRVYLNVFWLEKGNQENIKREMEIFTKSLRTVIRCQIARIAVVAKNDAISNALVNFDLVARLADRKAALELDAELGVTKDKT